MQVRPYFNVTIFRIYLNRNMDYLWVNVDAHLSFPDAWFFNVGSAGAQVKLIITAWLLPIWMSHWHHGCSSIVQLTAAVHMLSCWHHVAAAAASWLQLCTCWGCWGAGTWLQQLTASVHMLRRWHNGCSSWLQLCTCWAADTWLQQLTAAVHMLRRWHMVAAASCSCAHAEPLTHGYSSCVLLTAAVHMCWATDVMVPPAACSWLQLCTCS